MHQAPSLCVRRSRHLSRSPLALSSLLCLALWSTSCDRASSATDAQTAEDQRSVDRAARERTLTDARRVDVHATDAASSDAKVVDLKKSDAKPADAAPSPTVRIAAGVYHTCALAGGVVKCWGWNHVGELGLGDTLQRGSSPNQMGAALPAVNLGAGRKPVDIAVGWHHSCAIFDDGALKCWGSNVYGQLGLGTPTLYGDQPNEMGNALPVVDVSPGRKVIEVVAGEGHTCARLDDGSVKCWGANTHGKLGLGDTKDRGDGPGEMGAALPAVALGTGRTAVALAAGRHHVCALLDNGTVKCWGRNLGQLGVGDTNDRGDTPGEMGDALPIAQLGTGRTAKGIAAGENHSCAVLDNGTLKCWGTNYYGELGLGDAVYRGDNPGEMGDALPTVALGTGRTATAVFAGGSGTCALLDDRTLKCWGSNTLGELGRGDQNDYGNKAKQMGDALVAVPLGTGRSVSWTSAGESHRCALLDNHKIKCWGWNANGQLGLGDTKSRGDQPGEMGDALPEISL